ncbi:MAG TPA: hypothetical protein PLO78_03945 [Candidatus Omnitrophota bacterium]|nr:hypothetical protein [Candidatus Omnitrophota bacterium]
MKKLLIIGTLLFFTGTAWAEGPAETTAAPKTKRNPIAEAMQKAKTRKPQAHNSKKSAATEKRVGQPPNKDGAQEKTKKEDSLVSEISAQNQLVKSMPIQSVMTETAAEESTQNQLIKNKPYEYQAPVQSPAVVVQHSAPPVTSSRVTVCHLGGYEEKGMSAAECSSRGGTMVLTPEVSQVETSTQKK